MSFILSVPDRLVQYVTETAGEDGSQWLRDLPDVAARLMRKFDVSPEYVHPDSNRSLVVVVRSAGEGLAALKVEREASGQLDALRAFGRAGVGPEVLAWDLEHHAVLISWCAGRRMDDSGVDGVGAMRAVSSALAAMESPRGLESFPTAVANTRMAVGVARRRLFEAGLELFDPALFDVDMANADRNAGGHLLHGDLVPKNVLVGEEGGACLIDPEPLVGALEFDIANLAGRYNAGTDVSLMLTAAQDVASLDQDLLRWNVHRAARTYVAYQIAMGREVGEAHLAQARVAGVGD